MDNSLLSRYSRRTDKATAKTIEEYLEPGEVVLWEGKPDRQSYIRKSAGIPLPFVLIWFGFDMFAFIGALATGDIAAILGITAFLAVHMAPVWIYLVGRSKGKKTVDNVSYYLTNQRVILENQANQLKFNYIKLQDIVSVKTDQAAIFKVIGSITIQSAVFKIDFSCVEYYIDVAQLINDHRSEAERIEKEVKEYGSSKQVYRCDYCSSTFTARDSKCPNCGARAHINH